MRKIQLVSKTAVKKILEDKFLHFITNGYKGDTESYRTGKLIYLNVKTVRALKKAIISELAAMEAYKQGVEA